MLESYLRCLVSREYLTVMIESLCLPGSSYCVFPLQDWNATLTVTVAPPTATPPGKAREYTTISSAEF